MSKTTVTLEVEHSAQLPAEAARNSVGSVSQQRALPAIEGEYTSAEKRAGV
jgi:hypothetical protein